MRTLAKIPRTRANEHPSKFYVHFEEEAKFCKHFFYFITLLNLLQYTFHNLQRQNYVIF